MKNKFIACLNAVYTHVENAASFAVERKGETVKIYFEPSNGREDWKNNFDFPARPYKRMKKAWFCHRGFLKVWKAAEPYLLPDIFDLRVKKFEVVGYSHGAAVALLCYEYIKFYRPDVELSGVGFGCPRVLWGFAPREVKERFKGFIVVRNGRDLVTHVPPLLFGFRHVGELLRIGNGESAGMIKDHFSEEYESNAPQL